MKKFLTAAVLVGTLMAPVTSNAKGEDLVNCRWQTGSPIPSNVCAALRRYEVEDRAKKQEEEQQLQRAREEQEKIRESERIEKERRQRADEEGRIKFQEEEAQRKARYQEYMREEAQYEKKVADQIKAKKERCGSDYGTPRIGMTIERAQECVGKFTLTSQLNRADGVVSTYRSGRIHVHVMNGKIGAWDRY